MKTIENIIDKSEKRGYWDSVLENVLVTLVLIGLIGTLSGGLIYFAEKMAWAAWLFYPCLACFPIAGSILLFSVVVNAIFAKKYGDFLDFRSWIKKNFRNVDASFWKLSITEPLVTQMMRLQKIYEDTCSESEKAEILSTCREILNLLSQPIQQARRSEIETAKQFVKLTRSALEN